MIAVFLILGAYTVGRLASLCVAEQDGGGRFIDLVLVGGGLYALWTVWHAC